MQNLIKCENLSKEYFGTNALQNVNLEIQSGKIIGLLGPNGSGKTTLIKILNGLLVQSGGTVQIAGHDIGVQSKQITSYLPDKTFLNPENKVKHCIDLYSDFYDNFSKSTAEQMFQSLNINLNDKIKKLSKGNREKVALVLVMSRKADLYLLDEPIAGVDPAARDFILRTILTNYNENASIIISTHLISDIEAILSDVIFLKEGKVVLFDNADDVRERENKSIDELFREVFKC